MKKAISILLLGVCLLLAGCGETEAPSQTRPQEPEPTAVYDWMAGESPVPNQRSGRYRYGVCLSPHANSPRGVYFLEKDSDQVGSYILYADNGANQLVKLCSRIDCAHNNKDCNAYIFQGAGLSYYDGYLYAVYGEVTPMFDNTGKEGCGLLRIDPDGSNHMSVLDLRAFAKSLGGELIYGSFITDGVLITTIGYWDQVPSKDRPGYMASITVDIGTYYYKLDGSMKEPALISDEEDVEPLYSCGNTILFSSNEARQGGEHGSKWSWDSDTNTETYLADSLGCPGYFDEDEAYYFLDGAIRRKTYADNQETVLVDTSLKGEYVLSVFPDCLMLASQEYEGDPDPNLYFYNWNFELVETVGIDYDFSGMTNFLLAAETAERFILTDCFRGIPKYYINKSELGTGNVEIHEFQRMFP